MAGSIMKDPLDILRDFKAQQQGVSPEDIKFKDLRKKKKKKKSKKNDESEKQTGNISNDEGFLLSAPETQFCSYKDVAKIKKGKTIKKKEHLEEWGAFDFFRFTEKLYFKRYD